LPFSQAAFQVNRGKLEELFPWFLLVVHRFFPATGRTAGTVPLVPQGQDGWWKQKNHPFGFPWLLLVSCGMQLFYQN